MDDLLLLNERISKNIGVKNYITESVTPQRRNSMNIRSSINRKITRE